jgi:hypothetical protein
MLVLSIVINYLPPKWYKAVFRFSLFIMMLDFFLCLIWLPIAVHNTYGFRSAKEVFTMTCTFPVKAAVLVLTRRGQITALGLRRGGIGFCHCKRLSPTCWMLYTRSNGCSLKPFFCGNDDWL